jgi:OOP family OmpA-OmpF porin
MIQSMKSFCLAGGLALFALTAGCATTEPLQSGRGPALPDPGADQEYSVDFPDPGHGVARYIGLQIGEDLSKSCGLMRTYFNFDSATLSPQDKATLHAVAECLERPELHDTELAIVGRADSRGGAAYNADLGLRRAESIKKLLVGAGIKAERIRISSRGNVGATGDDKGMYSYGYDRRVDVVLVGVVRTPL